MTFDELWGRSTPNSWARVPRGPIAAAVGAIVLGSSGVLATTFIAGVSLATIGGFLITTAVTSWALSALTPKPPGTSSQTLGNVREAVGDFDIVYGEIRKGGTITFMETSDRQAAWRVFENDYLHFIITLAGHEVEEIGDVYFNDEKVTLDSAGFVTGDRWRSSARVKKHLGSPDQLADPDLVAETSVDSNFRGRGIAYLYVRLDWNTEVFANGVPTITAVVKGRKVHDPRSGTTAWTDNAALCIRDYLEQPFGLNSTQSPSSLGSSDWVTAANVCDTLVNKKDGSTEKRYALNGVISTANTPRTNLQYMLTSCGGTLFWGQGQWQFKVGYFPSGPYVSFNADDLRSGIDLVTKNSRKENFNAVTGTFLDKQQGYIEVDYPKVESSVFLQRDNNQTNVLDMSLPYTTSSSAAQRLAKMAMFRSREEISISADFGLKATKVKVGDVIQFTFGRYGFSNKYFEVVSWKPIANSGELKINLVLRETSAAAYNWNAEEKDIISNNTKLPNPTSGLTINNLAVTGHQVLQSDGSLLGEVILSWDGATSAFIDKYVVQWKRNSDASWSATETDEIELTIPSIKSSVAYNYRVKAVNFAGFSGPWEQISATVGGKQTPPGIPTNLQTKDMYKAAEVTWTNPTDRDLNHVEIWGSPTNAVGGAVLLGKSGGTKFIFNMEPAEEKWFFVRAVDNSNNKSAFTTGRKGTALFIDQSDVDIDVSQLLDDAGLSAVEVLPSLPTTGNHDGRTVYNTTDRQLHIYDGTTGTWKPAVETFDPEGLILDKDNFPPDLKPVEIVSSLPTTGNFEGRVVMLLGDGKLYRYRSGAFTASVPTVDLTGQVQGTQIAAGAITANKIDANAVTAGKIAAGAVSADNLQANIVSASKMAVGDITNYVFDVNFQDVNAWTGYFGSTWVALSSAGVTTWESEYIMQQNGDGRVSSKPFAVEAGEEFFLRCIARVQGVYTEARLGIIWYNSLASAESGTGSIQADQRVSFTTSTSPTVLEGSITAPVGATHARLEFTNKHDIGGTSANRWCRYSNPRVRRKNGGNLIVDGAITANKIASNSVNTNHLVANSITAGVIAAGAVSAAAIQANAVTADKINVNNLSAINSDLGAITGGSINIANKFIVNSAGTATIRSATSGERLVITNNRIDVYDASGTLRVRMGQL